MTAVLALEDVIVLRSGRPVLAGLSLAVRPGEVVALLGPSGSGKTTVLRLLLGLFAPDRGVVRVGGVVASADGRVLVPPEARGLGVVFQDLALWPHMTVWENLAFGLEARRVPADDQRRHIERILERVGLDGMERRYPGSLSGGERQRVAIARALVLEPRAALFDEPLSNLDPLLRIELLALLRTLLRERAAAALYVTHDVGEAAALADRLAILQAGRVEQTGSAEAMRAAPASDFVRALLST